MKNDLLLRTLNGERTERPPVWMMRQAGRYLPEYMELRAKYGFFERCQTPELACEITLQPIDIIGVDAAILFSDILVVPQAMGMEVQLIENTGPVLPDPIKHEDDLKKLRVPDVDETLGYVAEAIKLIKRELNDRVPLIGFAGAPWTLFCYMVQGRGSRTFDKARAFCYQRPELSIQLLDMITDTTIAYLRSQVKAGADVVQVFDSWAGILGPEEYERFSGRNIRRIVAALKDEVPVIVFAKGAWHALDKFAESGAKGLGIDWCISPEKAREFAGPKVALQGNLDPAKLLAPIPVIKAETIKMLEAFKGGPHIANLGHGITPDVPVDHAKAFVETVQQWRSE